MNYKPIYLTEESNVGDAADMMPANEQPLNCGQVGAERLGLQSEFIMQPSQYEGV